MTDQLPFFTPPGTVAMAHRGFSQEGLENSLAAFRAAVDLGYRYLETDVHTTSDGVVLLFHDPTLDRVTTMSGKIAKLSSAEVAKARIGGREPVPTLALLAAEFPGVKLNLDVKDWNSVKPLALAIEELALHDRVLVTSFSDLRRRAVQRLISRPVAASAGVATTAVFVLLAPLLPARLRRPLMSGLLRNVHAFQVPVRRWFVPVVTPGMVRRAHEAGKQVHVWTVNDPVEMHRLLDLGVDGLVTDRADLLRDVLLARGLWAAT